MPAAAATEVPTSACLRDLLSKQALPALLLAVFAWIVVQKAATLDFGAIFGAVAAIGPWQWAASALAAAVSFWAIGRMDGVVHRLMSTGVAQPIAQLSGIASVATAQLTGFGLLTGTLARWRVLPGISLWRAAKITGAVSAAFMGALAVLAAAMVLLTGPGIPLARPVAAAVLVLAATVLAASIWRPRRIRHANLPPVRAMAALIAYAALDTAAAALALYVLLPEGLLPPPALFYAVFLLALGAGLLGATPGGVGPFEMMFLACLPQIGEAPLLAAIMGYRLIYFALPALLAAALLIAGPSLARRLQPRPAPSLRRLPEGHAGGLGADALSVSAAHAEAGLMRQGEFDLLCDPAGRPGALAAAAGQSLIMLSDPLHRRARSGQTLAALRQVARARFLSPCIYKCGARTAAAARRGGWTVLPVAREAWIDPAGFCLQGPGRRQLRRLLRKARAAGVEVRAAGGTPPYAEMARVHAGWCARQGTARGFSMGRFDPAYVSGQQIYLAYQGGRLTGFLTLHDGWRDRALDLMCQSDAAPPGTMHLLLARAIAEAAQAGCRRVSLAAVPALGRAAPRLPRWLAARIDAATGSDGLARFKQSFDPAWRTLYLAAPGPMACAVSALDLADRIARPRRIMRQTA